MSPDSPMSQRRIDDLMQTLRRANAHYSRLAAASRVVSHTARKARKHARALRLSISVDAASTLDHRYISTVPLPILDLAPSPPPDPDLVSDATASPEIVAPIPLYPSQIDNGRVAEKITRPVLRCTPQTIVMVNDDVVSSVPECLLASQWSASTTGSGETEEVDDEEDTIEPYVPKPAQIGVRYPRTEDNETMDILVSPDDVDDNFAPIQHSLRPPLPARIPRQHGHGQRSLPQATEAEPAHVSSASDSSHSSLELVTPITTEELHASMSRIKRKSLSDDVNMDGDDYEYYVVVEKRPKYEHKMSNERRSHQPTTSWSRRNV